MTRFPGLILGLVTFAAVVAATHQVIGQSAQPDSGVMAALLGQCTYRDAIAQAQLQDARRQIADTAAWWAAYTRNEPAQSLAQPPAVPR
jgi:hypothetical protein